MEIKQYNSKLLTATLIITFLVIYLTVTSTREPSVDPVHIDNAAAVSGQAQLNAEAKHQAQEEHSRQIKPTPI